MSTAAANLLREAISQQAHHLIQTAPVESVVLDAINNRFRTGFGNRFGLRELRAQVADVGTTRTDLVKYIDGLIHNVDKALGNTETDSTPAPIPLNGDGVVAVIKAAMAGGGGTVNGP